MRTLFAIWGLWPVFAFAQNTLQEPQPPAVEVLRPNVRVQSSAPAAIQALLAPWVAPLQSSAVGLAAVQDIASAGGRHLSFCQTVLEKPVYQALVKLNLYPDGRVLSVTNQTHAIPADLPLFSPNEAHQTAENWLIDKPLTVLQQEPTWFVSGQVWYPAVRVHWKNPTDGEVAETILDTRTGQVLFENSYVYHFAPPPPDTLGQALVFLPDPLTTAEQAYGAAYVDNGDAATTVLDDERIPVPLLDIAVENVPGLGSRYSLEGPFVQIVDQFLPLVSPVTTADGNFFFNRSQSGFEDVMTYYHLDAYQRYVQALGFSGLVDFPLRADAHGYTSDQSSFTGNGLNSVLRFGEGGVDDAEDADVIIHEYGHALSYFAATGTNSGEERRGLDEGLCDYFAASISRALSPFRWQEVFTWDGHNEFWPGRSAAIPNTYANLNVFSFYDYGELWATAMMDLYAIVGREVADRLQLQELYFNVPNSTLLEAAQFVLDADTLLYGGSHTVEIATAFCPRELLTGQICDLVSRSEARALRASQMEVYPNPSSGVFQAHLLGPSPRGYRIQNSLGQVVVVEQAWPGDHTIDLNRQPNGLYWLVVEDFDGQLLTAPLLKQ